MILGSLLSTSFAGILLSSVVSAGSFVPSFTITFPVCTCSFNLSFGIIISPFDTENVPSIPGTVTTDPFG